MQKIIVFGRGNYYRRKSEDIRNIYDVCYFIDNAVSFKEIEYEETCEVHNPRDVVHLPKYPILICAQKFDIMAEQLLQLGVDEERIIFCMDIKPWDENENVIKKANLDIYYNQGKLVIQNNDTKVIIDNKFEEFKKIMAGMIKEYEPVINQVNQLPLEPLSRVFGSAHGLSLDRYYIEKFLAQNIDDIKGDVMEIAERKYINMFGHDISNSYALHVKGWGENVLKGNLETGEGIVENSLDCFICTQTIQFIYGIKDVIHNIYKMLKPGGVALISVPANSQISQADDRNWGEYWRFTNKSLRKSLEEEFDSGNIWIESYGNLKILTSFLYGLTVEEVEISDLEYKDEQYPLIIVARVRK